MPRAANAPTTDESAHDGQSTVVPGRAGTRSIWVTDGESSCGRWAVDVTRCTLTPVWPNLKRVPGEGAVRRGYPGGG